MSHFGSSALRGELSLRNTARAAVWPAELSYAAAPSVVYAENDTGEHGNFLPASYRRIRILKKP